MRNLQKQKRKVLKQYKEVTKEVSKQKKCLNILETVPHILSIQLVDHLGVERFLPEHVPMWTMWPGLPIV